MAKQNHPDLNPGDKAAEARFKRSMRPKRCLDKEKRPSTINLALRGGPQFWRRWPGGLAGSADLT
ncbi:MAG: hypothetical protein ACLS43_08925 [Evtepia gabavorous]